MSKHEAMLKELLEKSEKDKIDYVGQYKRSLVDVHEKGGDRFSSVTIVRFIVALIVIIFASLVIDMAPSS
jgi:hypothetical protein